jgi:hypothetical protein
MSQVIFFSYRARILSRSDMMEGLWKAVYYDTCNLRIHSFRIDQQTWKILLRFCIAADSTRYLTIHIKQNIFNLCSGHLKTWTVDRISSSRVRVGQSDTTDDLQRVPHWDTRRGAHTTWRRSGAGAWLSTVSWLAFSALTTCFRLHPTRLCLSSPPYFDSESV